jgi:hypothetical protein
MTSSARAFFDSFLLQPDRFGYLAGLVTSPPSVFETEWLEFKGRPQPHDVLKIWSAAVSGFANTEGGVIIWGIDCRRTEGVDAASALALLDDPLALKSQLQTNINQTTDPPVQGIDIEVVTSSGGKGFLVCFIPESTNKPHRSEQQKNKPYMIRCGDSFVIPSPSLLRAMFYPKVSPNLRILVNSVHGGGLPVEWNEPRAPPFVAFVVAIENRGSISAENLFVSCATKRAGTWIAIDRAWTASGSNDGAGLTSSAILHPGMITRFALFDPGAKRCTKEGLRQVSLTKFELRFSVYAKNVEAKHVVVTFEKKEIQKQETKEAAQQTG